MEYDVGNIGPVLGQTLQYGVVKSVNVTPKEFPFLVMLTESPTAIQIKTNDK